MLDYLVFHRSLIGESQEAPALLERYLSLVRNLKEGVHVVIDDPFQKATALLFELVMEEEFDPWEIDLVRFTEVVPRAGPVAGRRRLRRRGPAALHGLEHPLPAVRGGPQGAREPPPIRALDGRRSTTPTWPT